VPEEGSGGSGQWGLKFKVAVQILVGWSSGWRIGVDVEESAGPFPQLWSL